MTWFNVCFPSKQIMEIIAVFFFFLNNQYEQMNPQNYIYALT